MLKIEGFFIAHHDTISWFNLTLNYTPIIDVKNHLINIQHSASIYRTTDVVSFNAMYGPNGSGKTYWLKELALACSSKKGGKYGVLFSQGKDLFIHTGRDLQGWQVNVPKAKLPPLKSIFYSASPFENQRLREEFKNTAILDTSPRYDRSTAHDLLSVMNTVEWLNDKMAIFSRLALSFKFKIKPVNVSINTLCDMMTADMQGKKASEARLSFLTLLTGATKEANRKLPEKAYQQLRVVLQLLSQTDNLITYKYTAELKALLENSRALDAETLIAFTESYRHNLAIPCDYTQIKQLTSWLGVSAESKEISGEELSRLSLDFTPEDRLLLNALVTNKFLRYEFQHISSGEQALLSLFLSLSLVAGDLVSEQNSNSPQSVLFFIDEGETFLHPARQRQYLRQLMDYFSVLFEGKVLAQVIITTHSLIVAGDAPPMTLFDLSTMENVNAFGLGPKGILRDVYGEDVFAGELSQSLYDTLISNLKKAGCLTPDEIAQTQTLINSLADKVMANAFRLEMQKKGLGNV